MEDDIKNGICDEYGNKKEASSETSTYASKLEKLKKTAAQTCDGRYLGQLPDNINQDDLTAIANGDNKKIGYQSRLEAVKKKASGSGNYDAASIVCQSQENKKKLDYKKRLEAMKKRKDPDNIEKTAGSELTDISRKIKAAEASVDTEPSEAQIKAGNYAKGHVNIQGLDITIENPKGSTRSGISRDGRKWSITMKNSYGYFGNTEGKDSDHVDVFLGDNPLSEIVYIVDQCDPSTGKFDEHKVMLGFTSEASAKAAYLDNYEKSWKGFMSIKPMVMADFKAWVGDGGCWLLGAPSGIRERSDHLPFGVHNSRQPYFINIKSAM